MFKGYKELTDDSEAAAPLRQDDAVHQSFTATAQSRIPLPATLKPHTHTLLPQSDIHATHHKNDVELEELLLTNPQTGLTSQQAAQRMDSFGPNELTEVKRNPLLKFLGYFIGPIAFLIELSCIISAIVK
ncbi:hypothetical protein BGZ97_010792, partial [Linnemannia gamsii]